ncbi:MAG TPA: hypothetical protein VEU62_14930 [Bryobacterales bacterium]|nr:hypothetical protein [Bryobacterales bacterium]
MNRLKTFARLTSFLLALVVVCAGIAQAAKISGTISTTMTITEDSELVDDVTCTVTGAPCIAIGASHITLGLNGFTMTGQADSQTPCNGGPVAGESGIMASKQTGVTIQGPGLVRQFRFHGIRLFNTTGVRVVGVTTSTNCMSGIILNGGLGNELEGNVSVRNGITTGGCGGI